jgi:16S rRNA (guanine527-N7)-methyltransferase
MQPDCIAELLDPFLDEANGQRLTADDLAHISTYIDMLLRWNARINLTAIRDPEEIITRHFGESFFAARHLFPGRAHVGTAESNRRKNREGHGFSRVDEDCSEIGALAPEGFVSDERRTANDYPAVADIGSGAGFPGLPIKIWAPDISLTLIESNQKKATFLREVVRALTLTDVNILTARAETLPGPAYDLVTLRAVEHFETILPVAANLVAPGGRLALLIGSSQLATARNKLLDLAWCDPLPVPSSHARVLAITFQSK